MIPAYIKHYYKNKKQNMLTIEYSAYFMLKLNTYKGNNYLYSLVALHQETYRWKKYILVFKYRFIYKFYLFLSKIFKISF